VLTALKNGDGAAAKQAIRTDILDGNQMMLEFIATTDIKNSED
jgi:hypothetical protein